MDKEEARKEQEKEKGKEREMVPRVSTLKGKDQGCHQWRLTRKGGRKEVVMRGTEE